MAVRRFFGSTSQATYRQSRLSAANAALCMTGDAECRMGDPKMAHSRVAALMAG